MYQVCDKWEQGLVEQTRAQAGDRLAGLLLWGAEYSLHLSEKGEGPVGGRFWGAGGQLRAGEET